MTLKYVGVPQVTVRSAAVEIFRCILFWKKIVTINVNYGHQFCQMKLHGMKDVVLLSMF